MTSFEETTYLVCNRSAQPVAYEGRDEHPTQAYSSHEPMPENSTQNAYFGRSVSSRNGYTDLNELEMHDLSQDTEAGRPPGHSKTGVKTSVNEQALPSIKAKQFRMARFAWCLPVSFLRRRKHKIKTYSWTWELIALGVSVASMVAMISLLSWADNRPLLEWNFVLSFNTVISILGTLCKAPFGFVIGSCLSQAKWNWFEKKSDTLETYGKIDSASHSTLGSISLAWHIHIK
jgi:hypothetical protein